jgi:hypothetical protein
MDVGVSMSAAVLEHKLECAGDGRNPEVTWITRRVPKDLTPGWTNRLFVACDGLWRGYFPLSGDVMWTPEDEGAPWALIFNARGWTRLPGVAAPRFRGWRYLDPVALGLLSALAPAASPRSPSSSS